MPQFRLGSTTTHTLLLVILVGLVAGVFWQSLSFDFTNLDDNRYVLDNPALEKGLSPEGLRWAFTTCHENLWMPLTWLSFLADHQFFGTAARGYHATNLVLHLFNTILVYFLMWRLPDTARRARWAPFCVAALFAVHPLHVESVVWVAERKDVLSGFFFLLSLRFYLGFRQGLTAPRYVLALVFFALALMSKPMVVTLPVVLLLLDFSRLDGRRPLGRLLLEKVPFLLLSAGLALATYLLVQTRESGAPDPVPLLDRLGQAVIYYSLYLFKAVVPADLAVAYPPAGLARPWFVELLLALGLAALTWGAWSLRGRVRPVLLGWLWFLVMLTPVLNVVQGGMQVMSDRYFYLPSIGLFMAGAWLVAWLQERWAARASWLRPVLVVGGVGVVALFTMVAHVQTRVWRNSETLFEHALAVTDDNFVAHGSLGAFLSDAGRDAEALPHLQAAVSLRGGDPLYRFNLANTLVRLGRNREAIPHFRQAVGRRPVFPEAHNNLGIALGQDGRWDEAGRHFRLATEQDPGYAAAWFNLGLVQLQRGQLSEARNSFRTCLHHDPGHDRAARELARLTQEN